ncbi:hypothetical protein SPIRO4BDMA_50517 [uncultured spirochete]|uniref:Uncharacterized protein n=1 Tax=uncultured spirochete TaxID=156406 RepID=A0A3P3XRR6_9SPIR|nr:hypothetical protein SPIRO4BDMA_50517 [uncultured spirochete]
MRLSHNAVNPILRERGLKPHLVKSFLVSTDPDVRDKLKDVVSRISILRTTR